MTADMPDAPLTCLDLWCRAGSASEQTGEEGMAHFLEHMLFMGTEKYPSENEYAEFITNNGGYNNAFTDLTDTNYHF